MLAGAPAWQPPSAPMSSSPFEQAVSVKSSTVPEQSPAIVQSQSVQATVAPLPTTCCTVKGTPAGHPTLPPCTTQAAYGAGTFGLHASPVHPADWVLSGWQARSWTA